MYGDLTAYSCYNLRLPHAASMLLSFTLETTIDVWFSVVRRRLTPPISLTAHARAFSSLQLFAQQDSASRCQEKCCDSVTFLFCCAFYALKYKPGMQYHNY